MFLVYPWLYKGIHVGKKEHYLGVLKLYILLLHPYNSQGIQWVGENVILLAA